MKIHIKVKLKSKNEKIVKLDETHYLVFINAAPEKGKANKKILKMLAQYFDVSISKIIIISGEKSKEKIIEIVNI